MTVAQQRYRKWQGLIGVMDSFGHTLTGAQLHGWARQTRPRLIGAFCSLNMPATRSTCAIGQDYRGLQPYIRAKR
jgi:hypothetical protein